ncbi:MAG TPA: hydrogenase maturation protease [Opitutaceae bacterium]|nr:hydrogenase maturation protease [Opitutaceae bacterium]
MSRPSILVAGVGNIFLGDDGFGVAVARRLLGRPQPACVRVVDFGIQGIDLAYALLEPYEVVVLADVVQRNSAPGTIHVLDLADEAARPPGRSPEAHGLVPTRAIEMARMLGARIPRLVLVGCEPASFGRPQEGEFGLTPAVAAAVDAAAETIEALIAGPIPAAPHA